MSKPWFVQPGVILFTEHYDACVAFYRDALKLPVVFDKGHLITLGFGSGYLMIEQDGVAADGSKSRAQNPTVLRFNVEEVDKAAEMLRGQGIAVEVRHWDWGITGQFRDPDGNLCELKNQTDGFFALKG
jgi:lactoylglutathione lyase